MDSITYTSARINLAKTMDRVCSDHEPLIITRSGEQSVVILALDDFKTLEETARVLGSPANARRLLTAMQELDARKGKDAISKPSSRMRTGHSASRRPRPPAR